MLTPDLGPIRDNQVFKGTKSMHVLVVGAGIGGLTAALCLRRTGHEVTVFDSVGELKPLGLGINILPHGARVLCELDLEKQLYESALATRALVFMTSRGKEIFSEPRNTDGGFKYPQFSVHRGELQMMLLAAVEDQIGPDRIKLAHHFSTADQNDRGVTAHFVDRNSGKAVGSYTAELLIGADGLHSQVRKLFYPDEGDLVFSGIMMWRGAVERDRLLDGRTHIVAGGPDRKMILYPMSREADRRGRSLVNWVVEIKIGGDKPPRKVDWWERGLREHFVPRFADWHFDFLEVHKLFHETENIYEFPMVDREPVSQWTFGRVTLLGDAAHPMHPIGANGAGQAILDGEALAKCVTDAASPEEGLKQYEKARLDIANGVVLANRNQEARVLRLAETRLPTPDADPKDYITREELEEITGRYQRTSRFDKRSVNQQNG